MKKTNKYIILCPTFKRIIYKTIGIILLFLMGLSYSFFPVFWSDKEHISMPIIYSCAWMITRAGYEKQEVDNEKN